METINLTPTWKAATQIYLAVIIQEAENKRPGSDAMKNATAGIYEMAAHLDRFNSESEKRKKAIAENQKKLADGRQKTIDSIKEKK